MVILNMMTISVAIKTGLEMAERAMSFDLKTAINESMNQLIGAFVVQRACTNEPVYGEIKDKMKECSVQKQRESTFRINNL